MDEARLHLALVYKTFPTAISPSKGLYILFYASLYLRCMFRMFRRYSHYLLIACTFPALWIYRLLKLLDIYIILIACTCPDLWIYRLLKSFNPVCVRTYMNLIPHSCHFLVAVSNLLPTVATIRSCGFVSRWIPGYLPYSGTNTGLETS